MRIIWKIQLKVWTTGYTIMDLTREIQFGGLNVELIYTDFIVEIMNCEIIQKSSANRKVKLELNQWTSKGDWK